MEALLNRDALEFALIEQDMRAGLGSARQREAWQELEWRRCSRDPVYFIETYGYLVMKDGSVQPWVLWPIQRDLLYQWRDGVNTIDLKARQLGITTLASHFAYWDVIFKEAAIWFIVAKEEGSAKDVVKRIRATKDRLPQWMVKRAAGRSQDEALKRVDTNDAATGISYGMSRLEILTSTAKNIQGKSGKFILDDFGLHADQSRVWEILLPAIDGGGQVLIIFNGNGQDEAYELYQAAKRGENRLTPYFHTWRDDPTRDDAWYDSMRKEYLRNNPETNEFAFKAMYPETEEEAFFLRGNSRFELKHINLISKTVLEEERKRVEAGKRRFEVGRMKHYTTKVDNGDGTFDERDDGYRFNADPVNGKIRVYEHPVEGAHYVMGVDPSGGQSDGDYAVIQVCKILPGLCGEQVAVYQAKAEPTFLAVHAEHIGRYYNEAYCVFELNNHGYAFIDRLKENYTDIYIGKYSETFADKDRGDRMGYWTSAASKADLIDNLSDYIHNYARVLGEGESAVDGAYIVLHDQPTITELSRFQLTETASGKKKTGAPRGSTDDLVIGLGLCVVGIRDRGLVRRAVSVVSEPWEM